MLYAVLMYPLAYFYLRGVMFPQSYPDWGMPVFAALFIVYVDCAARAAHRTAAKETPLWAVCWMALAAAYPLYGYQPGPLGDWQWPAWHLFAVWYVLARCGMLAQGQSAAAWPRWTRWPDSSSCRSGISSCGRARSLLRCTPICRTARGHEKFCTSSLPQR